MFILISISEDLPDYQLLLLSADPGPAWSVYLLPSGSEIILTVALFRILAFIQSAVTAVIMLKQIRIRYHENLIRICNLFSLVNDHMTQLHICNA